MENMSKQDRQGARTPADVAYRYGQRFAEVMGVATDARTSAEKATKAVGELDNKLTFEEIFNRLTNNGEVQGVFRGEDGQVYINGAYIVALEELFAKNITMTGVLTNVVETFLEPGDEEIQTIQNHTLGKATIPANRIPLYDFNGDGVITSADARLAQKAKIGSASLANWSGAVKTPVTLTINLKDPVKAIRITGTNMWGREIDEHIGVTGATTRHKGSADYVVVEGYFSGSKGIVEYRKWDSGRAECWFKKTVKSTCSSEWGAMYATGTECEAVQYSLDGLFTDVPMEIVTASASDGTNSLGVFAYRTAGNTTTHSGKYRVMRPEPFTGELTIEYSFYVVGEWK